MVQIDWNSPEVQEDLHGQKDALLEELAAVRASLPELMKDQLEAQIVIDRLNRAVKMAQERIEEIGANIKVVELKIK